MVTAKMFQNFRVQVSYTATPAETHTLRSMPHVAPLANENSSRHPDIQTSNFPRWRGNWISKFLGSIIPWVTCHERYRGLCLLNIGMFALEPAAVPKWSQ